MSNSIAGTGSGGKSVPVKITVEHLDEQPIPVNQDDYWKKRCEAAEKVIINEQSEGYNQQDYETWYNLYKSSPSPTPVNDREDDEINNYYMSLFEGEADHHASSFHSIEDYDRVYRAVLHGCKFGFQERQKEIDVLDKAHDTTIEQLRMAQDERNKWKEMYESLTTTPTPIHDPEICGCGSHSDYCPYNPDASEVPENEKKLPKTSTIKTLINELFELMPYHINPYNLGESGRINSIIHELKKLFTPVQEGLREDAEEK